MEDRVIVIFIGIGLAYKGRGETTVDDGNGEIDEDCYDSKYAKLYWREHTGKHKSYKKSHPRIGNVIQQSPFHAVECLLLQGFFLHFSHA